MDPIADMLTRVRNASKAKHPTVTFQYSRIKAEILGILKKEGFIGDFEVISNENKKDLTVTLKYYQKEPVIRAIERVSSPGRRIYTKKVDLRPTKNNMGISIVSTSRGVTTGRHAIKLGVGGEILMRVW